MPVGTVPIYSMIVNRPIEELDEQTILDTIAHQAQQGVDYFTIHAGILKEHLPLVKRRTQGLVSRGGSLLATVLSTLPAWASFDPLPVLESFEASSAAHSGREEDDISFESLVTAT